MLRGKYLVDVQSVTKVQGVAFLADEMGRVIRAALGGTLAEIEQDKTMVARMAAATVGAGADDDGAVRCRAKRCGGAAFVTNVIDAIWRAQTSA